MTFMRPTLEFRHVPKQKKRHGLAFAKRLRYVGSQQLGFCDVELAGSIQASPGEGGKGGASPTWGLGSLARGPFCFWVLDGLHHPWGKCYCARTWNVLLSPHDMVSHLKMAYECTFLTILSRYFMQIQALQIMRNGVSHVRAVVQRSQHS